VDNEDDFHRIAREISQKDEFVISSYYTFDMLSKLLESNYRADVQIKANKLEGGIVDQTPTFSIPNMVFSSIKVVCRFSVFSSYEKSAVPLRNTEIENEEERSRRKQFFVDINRKLHQMLSDTLLKETDSKVPTHLTAKHSGAEKLPTVEEWFIKGLGNNKLLVACLPSYDILLQEAKHDIVNAFSVVVYECNRSNLGLVFPNSKQLHSSKYKEKSSSEAISSRRDEESEAMKGTKSIATTTFCNILKEAHSRNFAVITAAALSTTTNLNPYVILSDFNKAIHVPSSSLFPFIFISSCLPQIIMQSCAEYGSDLDITQFTRILSKSRLDDTRSHSIQSKFSQLVSHYFRSFDVCDYTIHLFKCIRLTINYMLHTRERTIIMKFNRIRGRRGSRVLRDPSSPFPCQRILCWIQR